MNEYLPKNAYFRRVNSNIHRHRNAVCKCIARNDQCSKQIIKAHSISSSALIKISKNNEVYCFTQENIDDVYDAINYSVYLPKKKSIGETSIFRGFCSYHDKLLFSCLEDESVYPNKEQIHSLMLRSFSFAYYENISLPKVMDEFINSPSRFDNKKTKERAQITKYKPVQKYVLKEMSSVVDSIIKNSIGVLRYVFLRLDSIPELMCCDVFSPLFTFSGKQIKPVDSCFDYSITQYISITISADNKGGYVCLIWPQDFYFANEFIDSWDKINYNLSKLYSFIFGNISNFFFNIDWWDNLSVTKKKYLMIHKTALIRNELTDVTNINNSIIDSLCDHRIYTHTEIQSICKTAT